MSMGAVRTIRSERYRPTAHSVAAARHLADELPEGCRDWARVVLSELASNAVRHARTPFEVTMRVGDTVWIGVRDFSRRQPRLLFASPQDVNGRGLVLISTVALRWGVDWRDGTKVVWAELPLDERARLASVH
jgi:anti-sigma regulatory factor (Ser/Thr protein kinase)